MGGGGGCCVGNCCIGNCCIGNCCVGNAIKTFFNDLFGSGSSSGSSSSGSSGGGSSSGESSSHGSWSAGRTESYDSSRADLEATVRVQKALTAFRTDTQSRSTKLENEIIKESREALDNFIDELKIYNKIRYGNKKLNINLNNIEREQRKTEDKIHGFIVNRIAKRISLDDEECYEILKLEPGKEKTKRLDEFYRKVLKEAVLELTDILRDTMEKQTDIVEERIQQRIDSIVDICETKATDFEKIQKLKEKDESKIEQEQIRLSHYVALCEYGMSILD